jgi:hypothetical protein
MRGAGIGVPGATDPYRRADGRRDDIDNRDCIAPPLTNACGQPFLSMVIEIDEGEAALHPQGARSR